MFIICHVTKAVYCEEHRLYSLPWFLAPAECYHMRSCGLGRGTWPRRHLYIVPYVRDSHDRTRVGSHGVSRLPPPHAAPDTQSTQMALCLWSDQHFRAPLTVHSSSSSPPPPPNMQEMLSILILNRSRKPSFKIFCYFCCIETKQQNNEYYYIWKKD